ncbi:MAG TPA: hydantoinase B/oxoprolinase family protein, partial [bacterium]|nr:hydantoinase B/oxoprolinase family protein [bacterium]
MAKVLSNRGKARPRGRREAEAVDPFTLEIIKNALVAIGDEMFVALQRTSMSTIIYEVLDYATGLTDARGQLITQGNGVTLFLGTLSHAVSYTLEKFGADLRPGDIIVTNDPYTGGGTHLSDVSLVMPIFYDGEIVAFAANKAHWTEVGGKDPGSWTTDATEVYQEGLQFPCVKLFDRGTPIESVVDLIRANVRLPDMTLGDMWAGVAALRVGD